MAGKITEIWMNCALASKDATAMTCHDSESHAMLLANASVGAAPEACSPPGPAPRWLHASAWNSTESTVRYSGPFSW